ncbi:MAG: hypothetical protein QOK42_1252 [Frankiaceae bacterium]|jgi:glycine/D-amino acid oxidase-like deaminating enzyme|nr:hypothetical protein [Frankiaceae bacterium]
MDATTDVVVIGAGVIGSSVAFELAKRGRQVTVVDKAAGPGQGSTSASSAIVRFNYSTFDGVATAWEALHCWQRWREHLGAPDDEPLAGYQRSGLVMLDVPIVPRERATTLFDAVGVPYALWSPEELRRRVPGIDAGAHWPNKRVDDEAFWADPERQLGAVFTPDAGFVDDPQLAALNLAAAAGRHGAAFLHRRAVAALTRRPNGLWDVLLSDGSTVTAPTVINVAGPWSAHINALAGVGADWTVQVKPMRQEVHHLAAPPGFNTDVQPGPVIGDLDLGTYLRGAPGDGLLVGGTEPECDGFDWVDDPDGANPHPTVPVFTSQVTRAARRFPELGVPGAPKGLAGVYDVSSDWTPIYDRTELDGFYVAIGTSGNQFKNAPLVGRFMAAIVDATVAGRDHDHDPVHHHAEHTGHLINLGSFSRRRPRNTESSGTVMG